MKYQKAWSLRRRANTRNVSFQDSFYGCQFTLSTQFIKPNHIAILLVQHLQSPTKRSQHFSTAYRNIVESNMLRAFRHPVATCCDRLGVENRTSAHYRVQHCCTNLSKRNRHQAASTNIAWKFWPFSNLSQHFAIGWSNARNMLHPTMLRYVALKCCDRLAGALRSHYCWVQHVARVWPPCCDMLRLDCEQSLFCSKIRRESERDGMRDIRAASGEAASRE